MRVRLEPGRRGWNTHQLKQFYGASPCFCAAGLAMSQDGFHYLLPHRQGRVERGHRVLEDDADAVAANVGQRGFIKLKKIGTLETGGPRFDASASFEKPQDGHAGDRLARATLANKAQHFTGLDIKAHAAHGLHFAPSGEERGGEVTYGEDRAAHALSLGSSASRNPSPRKLKANMVSEMAAAGKKS